MNHALLFSVFVVASCGLAYELIAGALASYLLGDSVTQFSTVIGSYLFAMGVGSWLSRYVERRLVARFIQVELMVGVFGGFSAAGLFFVFAWSSAPFKLALYLAVVGIGVLVGLEIPLIMRILERDLAFKDLVSQVLTFDYLGALAVSILFPVVLVPHLGLMRSALLFGLLNVAVALWACWLFREQLRNVGWLGVQGGASMLVLLAAFAAAGELTSLAEAHLYADDIVHAESTPYQRIVVTRWKDDLRLHLNNNLQFSSRDEYRYHEALVHPGLSTLPAARRVLVLGGGDGLAVREILKYPQIESVTLVDLDPAMTRLFASAPPLRKLNEDALRSSKVSVVNADALQWLEDNDDLFDFVVVDFPDPSNFAIGKLYSASFYRLLEKHLTANALAVIQSTSPLYARQSFWCVVTTLESVGLLVTPYHALVPSFGEWGFVLAGRHAYRPPPAYAVATRFLTADTTPALFLFPKDMARVETEVNRLNSQVLVRYFEQEWRQVIR
ncbi:MAG: polyamine aminopropyltransferase [Candidatus Accumulibacter sp.]|jgi:spermidine synthase|uniref:polyamine aminopropyltransferase n=1 Tax=Accumulibacter sp. TaxID=2053492 RepID=UPI001AD11154|nr:polyamine aminopropyltransferase [Accumulibacter sp.]MBK8385022.1 polyamine aminopropyltransferase [Accumulibacter sp.]MBK8577709.1 polyamine aminopropyltransferase [Candidatus Accumulibacter propinquus]MBN8438342.1 polyamine aminopropyltransferase [Accumulibacter sp.]